MADIESNVKKTLNAPPEKNLEPVQEAVRQATAPGWLRRHRSWLFQFYIMLSLLAFSGLALIVSITKTNQIDINITRSLQAETPTPIGMFLSWISWIGFTPQAIIIPLLVILLLYLLGLRLEAVMVAVAGVASFATNDLIKIAIHRARPSTSLVHVVQSLSSYSFPSGHVMFYVTFFGFLAFLVYTLLKTNWARIVLFLFFLMMIVSIGPSRIFLGEHWASDVLGAYILGFLILWGVIFLYRWGKVRYSAAQPVAPGYEEGPEPIPITGEKEKK